jgi:hypothetical protein
MHGRGLAPAAAHDPELRRLSRPQIDWMIRTVRPSMSVTGSPSTDTITSPPVVNCSPSNWKPPLSRHAARAAAGPPGVTCWISAP